MVMVMSEAMIVRAASWRAGGEDCRQQRKHPTPTGGGTR